MVEKSVFQADTVAIVIAGGDSKELIMLCLPISFSVVLTFNENVGRAVAHKDVLSKNTETK